MKGKLLVSNPECWQIGRDLGIILELSPHSTEEETKALEVMYQPIIT